ncbi:hypothetical protein HNY73_005106 [Argiope bruennichi]|uniref:Protein anon-73B1 n=1 Tax=Argiope bruennichi TaxID=94029 RepID=A0A8T0FII2_ARGBR|nr:hypothetical protein HNY73_005106 [Argiope bruennichi]
MGDIVDELLRYGLFFSAIFQLVCIAAVIFVPAREESRECIDSSDEDTSSDFPIQQPAHRHHGHHVSRRNRQEKKKRR